MFLYDSQKYAGKNPLGVFYIKNMFTRKNIIALSAFLFNPNRIRAGITRANNASKIPKQYEFMLGHLSLAPDDIITPKKIDKYHKYVKKNSIGESAISISHYFLTELKPVFRFKTKSHNLVLHAQTMTNDTFNIYFCQRRKNIVYILKRKHKDIQLKHDWILFKKGAQKQTTIDVNINKPPVTIMKQVKLPTTWTILPSIGKYKIDLDKLNTEIPKCVIVMAYYIIRNIQFDVIMDRIRYAFGKLHK
jgi:hypothetical protein